MTDETKKEQRARALQARRALTKEQRAEYSLVISERLASLAESFGAKTVLSYAATWDEADLSAFAEYALSRGITVAYPVSERGGIMRAYAPDGPDCWTEGILGIRVPDILRSRLIEPKEFDMVLVPLVAFDEDRRRLGHGGGYYDRYLPMCVGARFVAAAFEAQKLQEIASEEHDISVDAVVTEARMY